VIQLSRSTSPRRRGGDLRDLGNECCDGGESDEVGLAKRRAGMLATREEMRATKAETVGEVMAVVVVVVDVGMVMLLGEVTNVGMAARFGLDARLGPSSAAKAETGVGNAGGRFNRCRKAATPACTATAARTWTGRTIGSAGLAARRWVVSQSGCRLSVSAEQLSLAGR
jgi:hypothetical protein